MSFRIPLGFLLLMLVAACSKKETKASEENDSIDPLLKESILKGESVYKQYCIACHMADGGGAPPMNPPLTGTSFIRGDKNVLISVVLKGMSQQPVNGQNYHNVMPPLDYLTDDQIADVLTYVRNSFGNKELPIKPEEVTTLRTTTQP